MKIPERDTVLHGHHDRVGAHQFGNVVGDGVDLMGFQGQDHQLLHTGLCVVVSCLHIRRHVLRAVVVDQPDASGLDGFQVSAPDDERDFLAGQCQLGADITTDCPCSNYCNFHHMLPPVYSNRFLSLPMPSISISIVLPGRMEPTPTDVPHNRTSPGFNVMSFDIRLTSWATENTMSLIG